ncbi:MAG TPA: hypothetical protein VKE88_03540 [Candidatus Nanoarchaeia archaeon]|nr:hypothetical protein [Candidatus Nanoarchaeia archaeon]
MVDQEIMNKASQMRAQGMSNDEVAQRLLYQGYTNAQVFDAMSQGDVVPAMETAHMDYSQQSFSQPQMQMADHSMIDTSKISEIAESIIEEKWTDLVDHVNRIIEWKSSMELRLNTVDEQIKTLKTDFDSLHKAILGKINDSDSVMREVSVDIKALEQVFKKILPGFVENVNELSKITQNLKRK